jgi:23S rRNA-/tRNA-specific pseudouridylate synthase
MTASIRILFRSPEVVVVDKPAGIPTEPGRERGESLRDRVAAELARDGKSRGVQPHAVSRLDTNVTGAVVFSLGPAGAKRLAEAKEHGKHQRIYVALACGKPGDAGTWRTPIDGRHAETAFRAITHAGPEQRPITLLELRPRTGRTHQLRIHASEAGAPLAGDRRYGGPSTVPTRTGAMVAVTRPMLHARQVAFPGADGQEIRVTAPIPSDMADLWTVLDGRPEAWEEPGSS